MLSELPLGVREHHAREVHYERSVAGHAPSLRSNRALDRLVMAMAERDALLLVRPASGERRDGSYFRPRSGGHGLGVGKRIGACWRRMPFGDVGSAPEPTRRDRTPHMGLGSI